MVANHRTKGQSADSLMLVIGQNNSGDRATATTKLFSTLMTVLREKLGDFRSKKKKMFIHSGTYQIILYTHFITRMRGFLFILCVVLTIYCSAADRFQKWQEDDIQQEGLRVACAFTNKRQPRRVHLNYRSTYMLVHGFTKRPLSLRISSNFGPLSLTFHRPSNCEKQPFY